MARNVGPDFLPVVQVCIVSLIVVFNYIVAEKFLWSVSGYLGFIITGYKARVMAQGRQHLQG